MVYYYAVLIGRTPGLYKDYPSFIEQVHRYPYARGKGFFDKQEAIEYLFNTTFTNVDDTKAVSQVWIHGACPNNGTEYAQGGFGVYWGKLEPGNCSLPLLNSLPQTSNVAYLMAAITAIQIAMYNKFHNLIIYSNSRYLTNIFTSYIPKWTARKWTTLSGNRVKNRALIERLLCLLIDMKRFGGNVCFQHKYDNGRNNITKVALLSRKAARKAAQCN